MHEKAGRQPHEPPGISTRWMADFGPYGVVLLTAGTVALHGVDEQNYVFVSKRQITNANLSYWMRFEDRVTLRTTKIVSMVDCKLDLNAIMADNSAGGSSAPFFLYICFIINTL